MDAPKLPAFTPEEFAEVAMLATVRVNVLQRAIGSLIVTHPDPAAFARELSAATAHAQVEHHLSADATPWLRQESAGYAKELIDFAMDVAANRKKPS